MSSSCAVTKTAVPGPRGMVICGIMLLCGPGGGDAGGHGPLRFLLGGLYKQNPAVRPDQSLQSAARTEMAALDGGDTQVQAIRGLANAEVFKIAHDDDRPQSLGQSSQRLVQQVVDLPVEDAFVCWPLARLNAVDFPPAFRLRLGICGIERLDPVSTAGPEKLADFIDRDAGHPR